MNKIISKLISKLYHLPSRKIGVYNGVAVRNVRILDKKDVFSSHEKELIQAIRDNVVNGEKAVLIGGGSGASSVVTAHQVGNTGKVTAFEAVKFRCKQIEETIELNKVTEIVSVRHAIVEKPIHLLGDDERAPIIMAKELPDCDVLIMDCEGAEFPILKNNEKKPRKIIVETHSHFGSSQKDVKDILTKSGYNIISQHMRNEKIGFLVGIKKNNN